MITIGNYKVIKEISETKKSIVYQGYKEGDNKTFILKVLKAKYPSPTDIARFKQEYKLIKNLNIDGIVKAYNIEELHDGIAIVLEDFNGISLKKFSETKKIDIKEFLNIAIQLANTLDELHKKNIIHKDLKPSNIIINDAGKVKITDFGIASVVTHENEAIYNPNVLEGTLPYVSPEQTGRMNRAIDYRSDLYSLGITFYNMLTGDVPFKSDDPMELIHCHIAKKPTPPVEANQKIPQSISDIIIKLLSKQAEDRYQSGYGLKADLEECLNQLNAKGKIEDFFVGKSDIPARFQIPQKLYGREKEIKVLMNAFDRVSRGTSEMMLVSGYSGIGKSMLVYEIHKPIVRQRGYFISGKYDQFRRDVPYSAIIQAFQTLIRQLLKESEERIQSWKEKLLEALGSNGQVIINVIPALELIIDKQPEVPELGPTESQNLFNMVFQNFVKVFTRKEHPVTLFLDDLQWADLASLDLIKTLITNPHSKYLFLTCAYRDNEVNPSHPAIITIEEIKKAGITINDISLSPLSLGHVNQLISDSLKCELDSSKPLCGLVYQKTGGNPFFVNLFLKSLYEKDMLEFNTSYGWQWDIEKIKKMEATENVVELLISKIDKLPGNTCEVLKYGACIGNRFELTTLAVVYEKSEDESLFDLSFAIQEDLLYLSDDLFWFFHDRIQEAAYSMISDDQKKQNHLGIGRLLLKQTEKKELVEKIFYIVNQFNSGKELMSDQKERLELAEMNFMAGKKAKTSTAYASAAKYLNMGLELLPEDSWQNQYDLTYSLHLELSECEYLSGNFDKAERLFDMTLENAKTKLEKVKVYELKMVLYTNLRKYKEAVELGIKGAKQLFGVRLSINPNKLTIMKEIMKTKIIIGKRTIESLMDAPDLTDSNVLGMLSLLSGIGMAAYFTSQNLFVLGSSKLTYFSVKYGNSRYSPLGFVTYGMALQFGLGDCKSAYRFGQMAMKLNEKLNNKAMQCQVNTIFSLIINHWLNPVKTSLELAKNSFRLGVETGDVNYACLAATYIPIFLTIMGENLDDIRNEAKKYVDFVNEKNDLFCIDYHLIRDHNILNLKGLTKDKYSLSDDNYDEFKVLRNLKERKDDFLLFCYYSYKLPIYYLLGNYIKAYDCATEGEKYLSAAPGLAILPDFYFLYSLSLTALCSQATKRNKNQYLKKVLKHKKLMKKWADNCPENTLHKYLLVESEVARLKGKDLQAMELYDKAIESACKNGFTQNEAIANELAAKFYLTKGQKKVARAYMLDARYGYVKWGATAKVKDLDEKYPDLLKRRDFSMQPSMAAVGEHSTPTTDTDALDLNTIMKASQAISSEIELANLLEKLIKIVMENAGAEKGFFIMERSGKQAEDEHTGGLPQFVIEAEAMAGTEEVKVLQSISLEKSKELSPAIVQYVARTKEYLVLNDAANEGEFANNPYVIRNKPKSILCSPIIYQGKLNGILYLENNLTTKAFTPDRLEVLKLLSSQVAISIENALLYNRAITDGLTGLYNHNFFDNYLTQLVYQANRYNKKLCLLMIDIDYFKKCNDTYGHRAGDKVLRKVSKKLKDNMRKSDLCARYGGEEFSVILPETGIEGGRLAGEQIRRTMEAYKVEYKKEGDEVEINVTVSIGVAELRKGEDGSRLVERADEALYKAKLNGRNRVEVDT